MDPTFVLNAKQAIAKHVAWKMQLQFAITMREQLTTEQVMEIRHPRKCSIGHWLDSPATHSMRTHPGFRDLQLRHLQFHQEMMAIAQLITTERFAAAASAVGEHSRYTEAALSLALAITAYDRVLKIAIPVGLNGHSI